MATFSERSVEIGVVGLGECGCNLAVEFDRLGYAAVALNTSYTDLRGLPLTEKLYVGTNGRDGAGQDVLLGGQYLDANAEEILDRVQSIADGCDHILLTAGLGGGTGSNVITLANLISKLGRPISVFATLPKNQEGSIAKVNAVQAVSQFNDTDVTSVVLVDNEKILLQFGSNSLTTFYHNANSSVVNTLHEMNSLAHDTGLTPVRGFDGEDFRRVFTARGTLIYGQADLKREDLTVEDQLANGLQTIWDNAGLLAAGFDYQDATMAGIVLVAPESLLAQAPTDIFENVIKQVRSLTSTVGIYTGLFATSDETATPRLYTMLSGLPYPNRLKNVVSQAKEEGPALGTKVARPMENLDLGDLSDLSLFNSSVMPAAPVSPRPRQEAPPQSPAATPSPVSNSDNVEPESGPANNPAS